MATMSSSTQLQLPLPQLFADDFVPTLSKLSKFLDTLARPAFIASLALFLFHITGYDWQSSDIPTLAQPSAILLLGAALMYFGAFNRVSSDEGNSGLLAWLAESLATLQTIDKCVGVYFRGGLFVALTFYIPIYYYGVPAPSQPWLPIVSVSAIAIVGFFSPVEKFRGPIQFGYIEHSSQFIKIYESLPSYWTYTALLLVLPHLLLPWLGLGIILLLAGIFVYMFAYIFHQYRQQLCTVKAEVMTEVSSAAIAADCARDYVAEIRNCESRLLKVVTTTRREVLQAESIKFVDFFKSASEGWTAVHMATEPTKDVIVKAKDVIQAAMDANQADLARQLESGAGGDDDEGEEGDGEDGEDDEDDGGGIAEELITSAKLALEKAEDAEKHLTAAQEVTVKYEEAVEHNRRAREKAVSIANEAIDASKDLADQIKDVDSTLYEAVEAADKARRLGEQATSAAMEGEMQMARSLVANLQSTAAQVMGLKKTLATKAEAGRLSLHTLLEKV
ncbi:hypothetical protein F4779DRAFT_638366 [Xylariaceae sp. FL0662B]|nr:hypothetical protein F4779DRAFT_638366 [Xylariaceae sp. FL0662B]